MTDCSVCCEKLNKSNHKNISCGYCDFSACKTCIQKYLIESSQDPHCMNCKKIFTRDFLNDNCTKVFINTDLKTHRETVLLDRQKCLIPETQPYVILEKEKEKLHHKIKIIEAEKLEILKLLKSKDSDINKIYNEINRLHVDNTGNVVTTLGEGSDQVRKKFIRKCPMNECKGFLSSRWKCGLCETNICNKCNENENEDENEHVCKPENVASMELLNKDTKPCPACGTMICKISGCFAKNTEILLWNGNIKKIQDIIIGDELIGDDGNKRTVLNTVNGFDKMYKVTQSNGIDFIVNSKHTLLLKVIGNNVIYNHHEYLTVMWFDHIGYTYHTKNFYFKDFLENTFEIALDFSKKLNIPDTLKILVDDYIKLPETIKSKLLGFKGEGVNWENRKIDIDPYLLGLWLGDGKSNGSGFASNDNEIINYFITWANSFNLHVVHQDKYAFQINSYLTSRKPIGYEKDCPACLKKECTLCFEIKNDSIINKRSLNYFRTILNKYNLLNNKHIPEDFMMNSRENRLKLLAGIIDTDGYVSNEGKRITIVQVNCILSEQIILLAKSLGFVVNYKIVKKLQVKFPNTDKLVDCKDQYIINISGIHANEIPTILLRKKCNSTNPNKNYKKTSISVEFLGEGEYFGFLLDDNHNFVLNDFTVQKNCDQMWCPECQTAFSWNKGTIEIGVVHNPHYYDYMRSQNGGVMPRNPRDVPCGGLPDLYTVRNHLSRLLRTETLTLIYNIHNVITHIQHHELRQNHVDLQVVERGLRVKYLMDKISETEFKKTLQLNEKNREKVRDFRNIYQMFVDVCSDLFRNFIDNVNNHETFIQEQLLLFTNLVNYFNENIKKTGVIYKCVYPGISKNFTWIGNHETHLRRTKEAELALARVNLI